MQIIEILVKLEELTDKLISLGKKIDKILEKLSS